MPRLQHASMTIPRDAHEKVREFYGGVLGLVEKPIPHSLKQLNVLWFIAGEGEMELHFVPSSTLAPAGDPRHICLEVENLDEYKRRLTEAGYTIENNIPIPNRPRFFCRDPFGNLLEFTTILGDYREAE